MKGHRVTQGLEKMGMSMQSAPGVIKVIMRPLGQFYLLSVSSSIVCARFMSQICSFSRRWTLWIPLH